MPAAQDAGNQNYLLERFTDIDGLIPAIDRRLIENQSQYQQKKVFVVEGRNFLFDIKGPYSGFGSFYLTKSVVTEPELVMTFEIDGEIIMCSNTAILKYDIVSASFYPIFAFTPTATVQWPWSHAQVGLKHYFAKKGIGVIIYDPVTSSWSLMVNAFLPTNPCSVSDCRGRLLVLGDSGWVWSALDVGSDLTPSLLTGAGNQGISIVTGIPYMIMSLDNAFLVYTSAGIAISTFSPGQTPFQHRVLTRLDKAINPFCIVEIERGLQVFLDKKGLRQTDGQLPTPYQPMFSEYLSHILLPSRNLVGAPVFRLQYAVDKQLLFLSVASNGAPTKYDMAWVLYRPVDKWGTFDEQHRSILLLFAPGGPGAGTAFGFIDPVGLVHMFSNGTYRENAMLEGRGVFWQPDFDMVARFNDGIWYMPSVGTGSGFDESAFLPYPSNWYLFEEIERFVQVEILETQFDTVFDVADGVWEFQSVGVSSSGFTKFGVNPFPVPPQGLDAFAKLGDIRFTELKFSDQLGLITNFVLGVDAVGAAFVSEDWNDIGDFMLDEDWLDVSAEQSEDWGNQVAISAGYDVEVDGTLDGIEVFANNHEIPYLAKTEGLMNYYTCTSTGLYHTIKVSSLEFPASFHLQHVEVSGTTAGRL